jgi:hypothetical protein
MQEDKPTVEFHEGKTDILIVAPHAVQEDDDNTEVIAFNMAAQLECSYLINNRVKRGEGNYNSKKDAIKDHEFITNLRSILDEDGPTLVLWIHGIDEENIPKEKKRLGLGDDENLDCLIGYGQPDRFTALPEIVEKLCSILNEKGISARIASDTSKYRGWSKDNMNQWCRNQEEYNDLGKVQSIQLEFRKKGLRSTPEEAQKTGEMLAAVFNQLVRKDVSDKENLPSTIINFPKKIVNPKTQPDEALLPQDSENANTALVTEKEADEILVAEAFEFLKKTFREHFHEAMVEAGRYLIKMFYDDNYEFARLKKRIKKESLRQLILKLQENSGDAPSKTWIYDAVKLAVDEHDFESFRLYGKLGLSQKLLLTHVKDDGEKRALIEEAAENNYTVIPTTIFNQIERS